MRPFLSRVKELRRVYGEDELFSMLAARARHEPCPVLEEYDILADEALRFMSEPHPEIFSFDCFATSESLADLALEILGIKGGDRVADICCGSGVFLLYALHKNRDAVYVGIERNSAAAEAAGTRLSVLPCAPGTKIVNCDIFDAPEEKFDKIYCEPPFSLRFGEERRGAEFLYRELPWIKTQRHSTHISGCWSYVYKAASMLAEGGRAVCVMSGGPLWNSFDAPVREHLVKNGLIEAVAALPGGVTAYSPLAPVLVVISRGNGEVMMADARGACATGRRRKRFDETRIKEIAAMTRRECDGSRLVGSSEMEEKEWQFFPGRYLQEAHEEGRSVRLGDAAEVIRGAMMGSAELEALSGGEPQYRVINFADINDGLLSEELEGISALPERYSSCLLRDGDIVISKVGEPLRCAVITGCGDKRMIPSSNFYIVRVKKDALDPFYLKAYLESARGRTALGMISTGTAIRTVSASALKDLQIPYMERAEMERIAACCREAENELRAAREKINLIKAQRESLFDKK